MFNKVILVGNLTRDIELRYAQSGTAIASTSIAASRKFTVNGEKREEICFIEITFFGRSAEVANQYLRKGSKILVEGRLKFDQWVDQNGQKRSKHGVVVETMQMLDSKAEAERKGNNQQQQQQQSYQAPQQQSYQAPQQQQQSYQAPQQQQSYQAPQQQQQQSYQAPAAPVYKDSVGNVISEEKYNELVAQAASQSAAPQTRTRAKHQEKPAQQSQAQQMPTDDIPVIDIDEDEIPF